MYCHSERLESPSPFILGDGSPCLWRLPMLTYPLCSITIMFLKLTFIKVFHWLKQNETKGQNHSHTQTHTHTHTHRDTHTKSSLNRSLCRIKHNPLHGTQNVHSVAPFYLSSMTSNSLPTYNLCDAKMDLQLCPRQALGFPPSLALPRVCLIWPVPTVHILPVLSPTSVFL